LREKYKMSAQFINSNNQSLLWKVINNTPQTINYFANAPHGEKERWFQSMIGHVYKQYNGQNISLRDMNKRAIDLMLQSLQLQTAAPSVPYQSSPSVPYQSSPSVPYQSSPSVPYQTVKTREQQLTDQFNRRQAEYETMVKKEVPTPHFTENVKDEAILDLGSAVKEYMKQREQDIEIPKPAITPFPSVPSQSATPLKLDLKNAEPISLAVEELSDTPLQSAMPLQSDTPLKKVQWGENTEHVFDKNDSIVIAKLEKDIAEMKEKLNEILALLQK